MRVLLIEDHPLFARALCDEIARLAPNASITQAVCAEDAVIALREPAFDLVLVDLTIPGARGLSLFREIRARCDARVAIISANDNPEVVQTAYAERAVGFISKASDVETFSQALYLIVSGASYFPPYVYSRVGANVKKVQLTERELTVIRLIAEGKQNKEIARELDLGVPTIKSHIKHIYAKLGVRTRVAATHKAEQIGILVN